MNWVEWLQFILIVLGCIAFLLVCAVVILKARSNKDKAELQRYVVLGLLIIVGIAVVGFGPSALYWFGWDYLYQQGKGPEIMQNVIEAIDEPPSPPGVQITPTPVMQIDTTK